MATRHVLAELNLAAVDAGCRSMQIESVGGVDAEQRVVAGESFDLVFLASGALQRLADAGLVDATTVTPLVRSQVAVAVSAATFSAASHTGGDAFTNAAAMREALRQAATIGYSTGPSGNALLQQIDAWGLTNELSDRLMQAQPGIPVASLVAAGEVELGYQQLSELVGQPGIRILGVLPAECAIDTVFSGAVATAASDPVRAAEALEFFASEAAAPIITAHAFSLPVR